MTPERAIEIVQAINNRMFVTMDLPVPQSLPLTGVSLAQMVEAKDIVKGLNANAHAAVRAPGETYSTSVVPDDRLIAAVYAIEHFPPDNQPILRLPYAGFGGDYLVLAVLAIDAESEDQEEGGL